MRVYLFTVFLTFVVTWGLTSQAMAAPSTTIKVDSTPLSGESDPSFADKVYLSTIEKAPTSSIVFTIGYGGGPYLEKDKYIASPFFRMAYTTVKNELPDLEYMLEINDKNALGFFLGKRWYISPADRFLPYYRVAVGSFFDADAGLANFAEIRRLRARGAFGIGRSFFSELGVGYAITGVDYSLAIGYQFQF